MILKELVRPNIRSLKPYSSARNEFKGEASVFLDANENPYNAPYNRYPDPMQRQVKEKIARLKGCDVRSIFLGVGSDEPIDLLYRIFCEPGRDNVLAIDPSYGMYEVCADINDIEFRKILLNDRFDLEADRLLAAADRHTKLVFLCSPNNPTGNDLNRDEIEKVLDRFDGIVIVDEAYIDFSDRPSYIGRLTKHPNLVVLQTFSKAWGSAAIRLGMAFADPEIIDLMNKVKYPYNINKLTQEHALQLLDKAPQVDKWAKELISERHRLTEELQTLPPVRVIYPSNANFILVRVDDAPRTYDYLVDRGIIVRNRNNITLCNGCLRITVGTPTENGQLIEALKNFKS